MADKKIFVGRKAELEQFGKVLEDPKGQAVLVVGQAGMGKTWLINKFAEIAEKQDDKDLKCWSIRYEITPTDDVNRVMIDIMNDAADAIDSVRNKVKKFISKNKQKLAALLGVGGLIPVVGPRVKALGDCIISLCEQAKTGNVRAQFRAVLSQLAENLPKKGRVIFIIDPDKTMPSRSADAWRIIIRELPERIKFIFAQRPNDALINDNNFRGLPNVFCTPDYRLGPLEENEVNDLIKKRKKETKYKSSKLREVMSKYKGHPYAIQASFDLLAAGMKLEELPQDPTDEKIAEAQWRELSKKGKEAIGLFKAYAVLEVAVPEEVVEEVSGLDSDTRQGLLADDYLGALVRKEEYGKRIYHAILADYIVGQIGKGEKQEYHGRAVKVYREKLAEAEKNKTKPDALAAMRLPEHVLEAEGKEAFVDAFVSECTEPLLNLGLLDAAIALSERALGFAEKGSKKKAMVLGNLGLVYGTRGDLDKAEEVHKKALTIHERLDDQEGKAKDYGNLGLIYYTRGDLDKAEEMHKKSLEIEKKLGRLEGMASDYGNLGLIYKARGDLDRAGEMYLKSLEISEPAGMMELTANQYGNLGNVYYMRGELDKAEEMHKKALEIDEELGLKEGMASDYGNLGAIYKQRGDIAQAREYWEKAVELYKKIGMPHMVEKVEGWIEEEN